MAKKKTTKKTTKKAKGMKSSKKKMTKKMAKPAARMAKASKKAKAKRMTKSKSKSKSMAKAAPRARMATPVSGTRVSMGQLVPQFEVNGTGGQQLNLDGFRGRSVVLYFYPKDATPGCTLEGHEFTKLHDQFKELNVEVFGVSRDTLDSHEKFKTKECYSIDLLSDTEGELCAMFDVIKNKNMYGREVQGIERSTFVIAPDGRLVKEWRGVKAEGHAQQVLEFLKNETQNW